MRWSDSSDLQPFRNVRSGIRSPEACDEWEARDDPYRTNRVYLRNHEAGCWVEVAWTLDARTLAPFGIDVLLAAQAAVTAGPTGPPPRCSPRSIESSRA